MFQLDDNLLRELGLAALPPAEKNKMLAHIYETLELRVGMKLAEQMTDAQLDDFEKFIDNNDEAGALKWLETNFPNVPVSEVASTARAAELCVDNPSGAAIASELAAQLYGLKVIKARIEDNLNNMTRFLILSQKPPERTGKDKTSLMLSVKDKVGALYDLLRPFASHGLSMTKIESRPSRRKAWEYIFFVDVEGHMEEERVKKAIEEITGRCLFMKVLGSYPAHS